MKNFRALLVSLLAAILLLSSACTMSGSESTTAAGEETSVSSDFVSLPSAADSSLMVVKMFGYSGSFIEDASGEQKENVAAIELVNSSDKDIRLARIIVTTSSRELLFEATTIPGYNKLTVLEKNAAVFEEGEKITDIRVENRVDFEEDISFFKDIFQVTTTGYVFNVKNVSDADIESDIYVYYKKVDADGNLFGGITFRSKADGLNAGELKQIAASNFIPEDSKVVFIEYAGQ